MRERGLLRLAVVHIHGVSAWLAVIGAVVGATGVLRPEETSGAITVNAIDSGWYNSVSGIGYPDRENYAAGEYLPQDQPTENRNYFVFDLSGLTDLIAQATLHLYTGTAAGPGDPCETYRLYDVTTPIDDLRSGGGDAAATFTDLGSGTVLGERVVHWSENESIITIELTPSAVDYLNSTRGLIALGGRVTTIGTNPEYEYLFGGTESSSTRQLVLTYIPEPAALSILALGGLAFLGRWRVRQRCHEPF